MQIKPQIQTKISASVSSAVSHLKDGLTFNWECYPVAFEEATRWGNRGRGHAVTVYSLPGEPLTYGGLRERGPGRFGDVCAMAERTLLALILGLGTGLSLGFCFLLFHFEELPVRGFIKEDCSSLFFQDPLCDGVASVLVAAVLRAVHGGAHLAVW